MRIVLRDDVDNLGKKGEVVDVADGYARNYLVPRGLALKASAGSQKQADAMVRNRAARDRRERENARSTGRAVLRADDLDQGSRRRRGSPLRFGHRFRHRRGGSEPDRGRDRSAQAGARRAAERARPGRRADSPASRRGCDRARRGRSGRLTPRAVRFARRSLVRGAAVRDNHIRVICTREPLPGRPAVDIARYPQGDGGATSHGTSVSARLLDPAPGCRYPPASGDPGGGVPSPPVSVDGTHLCHCPQGCGPRDIPRVRPAIHRLVPYHPTTWA